MVDADIGIFDGGGGFDRLPVLPFGIARHQHADHLFDIIVRPAQPVLHRQEPIAQILAFARDQAEDLGQAAQGFHLAFAGFAGLGSRFQPLEQTHQPAGGLGHIQIAHFRQFDDIAVGDDVDHRVAARAARQQVGQDRSGMRLEEQKVCDDDIGGRDGLFGIDQRSRILAPFGGGMDGDIQPRKSRCQLVAGPHRRACGMRIQRQDDKAIRAMIDIIAHNVPLLHTAYQG